MQTVVQVREVVALEQKVCSRAAGTKFDSLQQVVTLLCLHSTEYPLVLRAKVKSIRAKSEPNDVKEVTACLVSCLTKNDGTQ